MKKILSLILCCALVCLLLTGCGNKETAEEAPVADQGGNFAPETTAVASGGLMQVIAEQEESEESLPGYTITEDDPAMTVPEDSTPEPTATPEPVAQPVVQEAQVYATASPQPNAYIGSYMEASGMGLGFRFSYPSNWTNIPGRSTVCFVQPMQEGTVYPARVAVSMKKVAHNVDEEELQKELVLFFKTIETQYDAATFEIDKKIDDSTRFISNDAYSTTYLAYDGDQEIQGYVIMTSFEKYIFCYHFQCAFSDYNAFVPAMNLMRDSVTLVQEELQQ